MNWLEAIGLITVIFIILGFINDFLEKEKRIGQQNSNKRHEQDLLVAEAREHEAQQGKWKRENPDRAEEFERKMERTRIQNEEFFRKRAEIKALEEKFLHAKPEDKQAIIEKLQEIDKNESSWVLWEARGLNKLSSQETAAPAIYRLPDTPVPETEKPEESLQIEKNLYVRGQSKAIRSADDIIREFNISGQELATFYSSYKFSLGMSGESGSWNDEIEDFSRSTCALSDEEISLAKTNLDQAILNRIIIRLVAERTDA